MIDLNGLGNVIPISTAAVGSVGASGTQSVRGSSGNFSTSLNEALREQTIQSITTSMNSFGGPGMVPGVHMSPATTGLENTMVAVAESGEMSGAQLMLFMMIMMMQTSDGGSDMSPIMQMLARMLSNIVEPNEVPASRLMQDNMMNIGETDPGIRRMIDAALSQVGYRERNSDGSFGTGNISKFGAWYGMDGQPWCAMFVSWAADQGGILNSVVPKHASTARGVAAYQEKGLYSPRNSGYIPREGDAIFFHNPSTGRINHVGIVVAFDSANQRIYTVEGNTSDAVHIRHYDLNNPRIHGFGRNGGTGSGIIPGTATSGNGTRIV